MAKKPVKSLDTMEKRELLRQVRGEYEEKLAAVQVEPVLLLPEEELFAEVDGTLMWRVADNLFSNVCKYAQPGTRFYVEAERSNTQQTPSSADDSGPVQIRFKNISRDSLNITPEELTERFVRGDRARGGEGSGLGLHIAKSLTELMGGTFLVTVDGDLFKVELTL